VRGILCICIMLAVILTLCSQSYGVMIEDIEFGENYRTYGIYMLIFRVKWVSGWPFGWDFVYSYGGQELNSGNYMRYPLDIFTFLPFQVNVIERDRPENVFFATMQVAICDGGYGKTEITVTDSSGKTAVFQVVCKLIQVDTR